MGKVNYKILKTFFVHGKHILNVSIMYTIKKKKIINTVSTQILHVTNICTYDVMSEKK